jgi:hypothetical protein
VGNELIDWLKKYKTALLEHRNRLTREKDVMMDSLVTSAGGLESYLKLKRTNHNEKLAQLVLNRSDLYKIIEKDGLLIRKMDPLYMLPLRRNGRAHFFASTKILGDLHISTLLFNLLVIWIMTLAIYLMLRFRLLHLLIELVILLAKRKSSYY